MVGNRDLFIPETSLMFKHVGEIGCDVQDVLNVVLAQHIKVGRVFGTAQVKVRQDLNREGWLIAGKGALL